MIQFDFVQAVKTLSKHWHILALLMIAGGLCGFLISRQSDPLYESSAVFSVTIDYTQTGALTDVQEDQAMRGVGSVILADQVIFKTLEQINYEGVQNFKKSDFLENSFLDREEFRWTLRFRDPDPVRAAQIVNIWADNADKVIHDGLSHAVASDAQLGILNGLKTCFQTMPESNGLHICGFNDLDSLISAMSDISAKIQNEKEASFGLFNSLSVALVNRGETSQYPVIGQRNLLVVSGALAGFFIGILIALADVIRRRTAI